METRIRVLGFPIRFTWWAEEKDLTIKIRCRRERGIAIGQWKAGDDVYIEFLGLHVGFIWWSNVKHLEIGIHPAYSMCLRSDGSKHVWRGTRVGGSALVPIGLK